MKAIRALMLGVVATFSVSAASPAQVPADLRAAMGARDSSIFTQDTITFARYTADEFVVVLNNGATKTKATRLGEMRAAKIVPFSPIVVQEIHVYGNVAVRRSLWSAVNLIVTDVWVKNAGVWQVVSLQQTPIKKP